MEKLAGSLHEKTFAKSFDIYPDFSSIITILEFCALLDFFIISSMSIVLKDMLVQCRHHSCLLSLMSFKIKKIF